MPLAELIDDPRRVLNTWPTEPLLVHHAPDAFRHLLALDEVQEQIDNNCIAARNLALIKDGRVLERKSYVLGDMPSPGAVRTHLDTGGTISIRQLETVKPALARLQREIRDETFCRVHVNAYMTPGGHQGLKYHYDPYVTLIVQLAGRKTWPYHRPMVENPVREYGNFLGRGWSDEERRYLANTPPEASPTLEPGDVFWLPRGYVHSPYAEEGETSLHLTFALKEPTQQWAARVLTEKVLAAALREPELRAEIPPSDMARGPVDTIRGLRQYLVGSLMMLSDEDASALVRRAALEVTL